MPEPQLHHVLPYEQGFTTVHVGEKRHVLALRTARTLCGLRVPWAKDFVPTAMGDSERATITCKRCYDSHVNRVKSHG